MNQNSGVSPVRRLRSSWRVLTVGLLAGLLVGGAGVSVASSTRTVTFCVNKKTAVVRQPKSGRCAKTETRLVMNATGPAGATGATGATGPQGPAGAQGVQGPAGSQGPAGVAGVVGAQGPAGAQGATGPAGASGNQWTEFTTSTGGLSTTQWRRISASPFDFRESTDEQFTLQCWVEAGTTPTHVIEYVVNTSERVTATAYPLGGSGSVATWIVTSTGRQDLGTARTTSTRWIIEVRTAWPNETTRTYELVVEMTPVQGGSSNCSAQFSKRG